MKNIRWLVRREPNRFSEISQTLASFPTRRLARGYARAVRSRYPRLRIKVVRAYKMVEI